MLKAPFAVALVKCACEQFATKAFAEYRKTRACVTRRESPNQSGTVAYCRLCDVLERAFAGAF